MGTLAALPTLLISSLSGASTGSAIGSAAASALGPSLLSAGISAASAPKAPKPPPPPNPAQFLAPKAVPSLFEPGGDTANGTLFAGNRAPQISGGKKTLLGQ